MAELVLPYERNDNGERLTCMLCNRGEGEHETPPEFLVTFRNRLGVTVTAGLHQSCAARNEKRP